MADLFPSILPGSDREFTDSQYLRAELEKKEYAELQSIAAEHPSEEVHGRMSETELLEGLTGKGRV